MLRIVLCLLFTSLASVGLCQPENSTCNGVIDLGTFPYCRGTVFTNSGATPYDIMFDNNPSCFKDGSPTNDVWFAFKTSNEKKEIVVNIEGTGANSIKNIQVALYRGLCEVNSLALRKCAIADEGKSTLSFDAFDLTPNAQYYVRVDNYGGDDNEGDFTLCIDELRNDIMITNGSTELCSGRLFDSGGPTGNYGDNENYTYTICPSEFHQCLSFDLAYFNIEHEADGIGEKLIFYNGPNTDSPIIATIGADVNFGTAHGGGGTCYKVQADDCLTIQFISDGSFNLEGFEGSWECSIQSCEPNKQIKISGDISAQEIEDAITTPLSKVRIDKISCNNKAYGTFNGGDETDLGLNRGLLLTTGSPFSAIGPNNDDNVTSINEELGDNDLDILSQLNGEGSTSNDACVIEMEVEVFSNELTFEYIFASDEYPEFVGESFNDIFALLISGPGIDGIPEINNQKNLATLPNGEFVQINSVNHLTNWEYYRNNAYGQSIEYDGMTLGLNGIKKSLTASAEVIPCNTYRLKLAIADRGDFAFDSGVFIAEISSGVPALAIDIDRNTDYLVERCSGNQDKITIALNRPLSNEVKFTTNVSGTATRNIDFQSDLPSEIIFAPGETSKTYSIIPISDELPEGTETIIIKLINETECGTVDLTEVIVELRDEVDVSIGFDQDTIQSCLGGQLNLTANGAIDYTWSSNNLLSDPFVSNPTITLIEEGWTTVKGTLGSDTFDECVAHDSVFVELVNASVEIDTIESLNFCQGEVLDLKINSNVTGAELTWTTDVGEIIAQDNGYLLSIMNSGENQSIIIDQSIIGCTSSDTLLINVDEYFFPTLNFLDTAVCQSTPISVVPFVIPSSTIYTWNPSPSLSETNIANPTITPALDETFTLSTVSENGYCRDDTMISITVIENEIIIQAADTVGLCAGDTIDFSAVINSASEDPTVEWFFDQIPTGVIGLEYSNFENPKAGYLSAYLSAGACNNGDSIFVQTDDLPDLTIRAIPDKNSFCEGEVVTLLSNDFTNSFYPNISFEWLDISPNNENLNVAINTDKSRHFVRKTTNGLCMSTDSIYIKVEEIDAQLNVQDTVLCRGDLLPLELTTAVPSDEVIWIPEICISDICNRILFEVNFSDEYQAVVKSGRCRDTVSFNLEVIDYMLNIIQVEEAVPLGAEIMFEADLDIEYDGPYYWYVNDELVDEQSNLLTLIIDQEFMVIKVQIDLPGCGDTEYVIEALIPEIVFPNAFIPKGRDNLNQRFTYVAQVNGQGFEKASLEVETFEIFNRWGELVFECSDLDCLNRGWDGRRNGKEAPSEVYAYIFRGALPNGDEIIKKGNVTLLR